MAKITIIDGPDLGCEYPLPERGSLDTVVIGRDPGADIVLNDQAASREHCRLVGTRQGHRLVDLGSRNRTFVNGEPIEEAFLRDGDVVRIGDTDLRFEDEGAAIETTGVASTIIREIPINGARRKQASFIEGVASSGVKAEDVLDELEELLRGAQELGETSSAPELLERYLSRIASVFDGEHAAFLVRSGEGWVARASYCATSENDAAPAVSVSQNVVDEAARGPKAVLSTSTADDDRFSSKGSIIAQQIATAMAVPVLHKSELLGVVYLDRRRDAAPFDERHLGLLERSVIALGTLLHRLEEEGRLLEENRNLLRKLTENRRIIGDSPAIRGVLDFVQKAAPTPMTVLIEGETGTGKELVAAAIHYNSPRRGRPFVAINCAALPETLIESELFGHERGAFTGAAMRKKGRFELADTGTVFLDEIGELSLACQAKLLRLLEERSFERVGGTESIDVDVRIIAATNKDLVAAVEAGEFREDLLYRLNVLRVVLPPLRERENDIIELARFFLAQACPGRPKKLGASAQKKLLRYHWPGNVRQLRNVIESAAVLSDGKEITAEDLTLPERRASGTSDWQPMSLQELEKIHILRVLEHTKGNKKRAAEILGIERCTLYSKLKSYDA